MLKSPLVAIALTAVAAAKTLNTELNILPLQYLKSVVLEIRSIASTTLSQKLDGGANYLI